MTDINIEALRALVDKCEASRLSGPLSAWGIALQDLSRAMTPGTVLTLLAELAAARAELAAVDRSLGIPPDREPRRLELLVRLRAHYCDSCNGTGYFQGPRLGDERCEACGGFGIPKVTK